jgi:ATP-dependent DNA helicase RecG
VPISLEQISKEQADTVILTKEGQFADVKAIEIAPAKLTKTISAFANSDGGDLYVGIDEVGPEKARRWRGFQDQEAANGHLQIFEKLFPLGTDFQYEFLRCQDDALDKARRLAEFEALELRRRGQMSEAREVLARVPVSTLVLHVQVNRTQAIMPASNGIAYVRRGASSQPVDTPELIKRLEYSKGISSFESEATNAPKELIINSDVIRAFIRDVVPTAEPENWLKKQVLLRESKPTVAGVLLFADEPQALIPKHCGVKVYRYKTQEAEGAREALAFTPKTVEGDLYAQIKETVRLATEIVESIPKMGDESLKSIKYPTETLHEIITNAVLHRDYSIADDVHIRIFDNRIEVQSPGRLPAHITVENILDERFARNGAVVRILNKFKDPPNKDVGEGLNTAFAAMQNMGLKDPIMIEKENSVLVTIKHELLASPEEAIMDYLETHPTINNSQARQITYIRADYRVKGIFVRMVEKGMIEQVPGTQRRTSAYRKVPKPPPTQN